MAHHPVTPVFIATGASGVGKTTTLHWLRDHHGRRIHAEAHGRVLAELGARTHGHPPDQPYAPVADPDHFCPVCRTRDFCDRVIAVQNDIERSAQPGDLMERGWLDPIEFHLRHGGAPDDAMEPGNAGPDWIAPDWQPAAHYARIFLFEVMPDLQRPKWGRSAADRVEEALRNEARLDRIYRAHGYDVVRVPPGPVEDRARFVLGHIAI